MALSGISAQGACFANNRNSYAETEIPGQAPNDRPHGSRDRLSVAGAVISTSTKGGLGPASMHHDDALRPIQLTALHMKDIAPNR